MVKICDKPTALSGKDMGKQYAAFLKYTILPPLKRFERILEARLFSGPGPRERAFLIKRT
jgi:hypothetical protein